MKCRDCIIKEELLNLWRKNKSKTDVTANIENGHYTADWSKRWKKKISITIRF